MSENLESALSAFLDGEPASPADVLAALDTEAGRSALADFVRLRVVAAESGPLPGAEFHARMRAIIPNVPVRPGASHGPRHSIAWAITGAVAASLFLGFLSGSVLTTRKADESVVPPKAARVVEFQPGVDWQQIQVKVESR